MTKIFMVVPEFGPAYTVIALYVSEVDESAFRMEQLTVECHMQKRPYSRTNVSGNERRQLTYFSDTLPTVLASGVKFRKVKPHDCL